MGGKSAATGQRLFLCFALLIAGTGCALLGTPDAPESKTTPAPQVVIERPPPPPPPAPSLPPIEPKEVREAREADAHLEAAQQLMTKGDFEGALRESQKSLALAKNHAPADAAIFHMGLIYAHPNNPKKNNKRAISYFGRVVKSYPESPLAEQAKIWIGVLDGVEKLRQVDIDIEEKKRDRMK